MYTGKNRIEYRLLIECFSLKLVSIIATNKDKSHCSYEKRKNCLLPNILSQIGY